MYDSAKLARGAQAAYNLAPQPATFLVLVRAAHGTLSQLRGEFATLPPATQSKYESWAKDASAYDSRLTQEHVQAEKLVTMIQEGTLDWQAALSAGTDYAKSLKRFFQGRDSSYWAELANRLSVIRAESVPGAEGFQRPWLLELWMPWTAAQNLVVEELAEAAATTEMGQNTRAAVEAQFDDAQKYLGQAAAAAGLGLVAIAGIGLGVWFLLRE